MTVDHMRAVMSQKEFLRWSRYYATKAQKEGLQETIRNRSSRK